MAEQIYASQCDQGSKQNDFIFFLALS